LTKASIIITKFQEKVAGLFAEGCGSLNKKHSELEPGDTLTDVLALILILVTLGSHLAHCATIFSFKEKN
jgi:hypothetical protein